MGKHGQYNYKGINSQSWAAMSLFLQFLKDPKFQSIQLEAPFFEDFNLIFNDDHKLICESKDWKKKLSYSDLKNILENLVQKKSVKEKDEILIVCSNVDDNLVSDVKNIRYFNELKKKFKKKKYSQEALLLLPQTKFWVVPQTFNENVIYSLFTELIDFWLPPEEIKRFVDSLLIERIYKGSQSGSTYDRTTIFKEIESFKEEIQKSSDTFNSLKVAKTKQFKDLEKIVNSDGKISIGSRSISALSARWDLTSFAMDRLKKRKDLNLEKWDELWKLNTVRYFTFGIFNVFENNLHTEKNQQYVLKYIKRYTKTIRGFYQPDFFDIDVVKIVAKIIESKDGSKHLEEAFLIIEDLITFNKKEFFYLKSNGYGGRDEWERGEICKLLFKIYNRSDSKLKQKIFNLIVSAFNITQDDGEFNWHAPKEVYQIFGEWLEEDFEKRFEKIVKIISEQYDRYYKKFGSRLIFNGWEHMGGGVSFGPGGYLAGDRHFIDYILSPSIQKKYESNKSKGWIFIKKNCIAETKEVSKSKPDFLNRAVFGIVLQRYIGSDLKDSKEAFIILKEFILSRKGIPHKSDLIYQATVGSKMNDDKKWKLIELTVKKYGIPVNPFAEQIVANLARSGYKPAKETLEKWFGDPKYYEHLRFDRDVISSISVLLDSDLGFAISLFKTLIVSDYVRSGKSDHFSAYKVAELLYEILKKDYKKGLSIIKLLEKQKTLSDDQQIIFAYGLFSHIGNDGSDDVNLLMKVYKDVVDPFLQKYDNNINKVVDRLSHAHCRDAFVQFATRLATKKKIIEAIRIVTVFIDDPDPYLLGKDPEDLENKYNEHKRIEDGEDPHSITSTRGWCGWALMKCSLLAGRDQVSEIIKLTRKLVEDENYYVVHMGTFALHQLAVNRLTVLPSDKNTLFFNDNKEEALKMAKQVEQIAFDLLGRFTGWSAQAQKAMAKSIIHTFDPIRALNKKDSLKFLNALSSLNVDAIEEAAPLFLFYAELRVDGYKDWRFSLPGLYDDLILKKEDVKQFKSITKKAIQKVQTVDPDKGFKFISSAEHLMRDGWKDQKEKDKYTEIALDYFDLLTNTYAHNIFSLVYRTIKDKMISDNKRTNKWYELLKKCLKIEEKFYKKQLKEGNIQNVYWYASLYHSEVLEAVFDKFGEKKFMDLAKIFFLGFPKEINLHETDRLVSIIKDISKRDKDAKKIIKKLVDVNPSKYWGIDKKDK